MDCLDKSQKLKMWLFAMLPVVAYVCCLVPIYTILYSNVLYQFALGTRLVRHALYAVDIVRLFLMGGMLYVAHKQSGNKTPWGCYGVCGLSMLIRYVGNFIMSGILSGFDMDEFWMNILYLVIYMAFDAVCILGIYCSRKTVLSKKKKYRMPLILSVILALEHTISSLIYDISLGLPENTAQWLQMFGLYLTIIAVCVAGYFIQIWIIKKEKAV